MKELMWIASYPRSGTTWLRFMLNHYLYGPHETTKDISMNIPDQHARLEGDRIDTAGDEDRVFVKTHQPFSPHMRGGAAVIHLVRNPRDVLISCLHYFRMSTGIDQKACSDEEYARKFIQAGGCPRMIHFGFGSWIEHSMGWLGQQEVPRYGLPYEYLKGKEAYHQLHHLLGWLEVDVDLDRLREAYDACSFDNMQKVEDSPEEKDSAVFWAGSSKASAKSGERFVRSGVCGQLLDEVIAPGLDELFDDRFGEAAAAFGYGPAT